MYTATIMKEAPLYRKTEVRTQVWGAFFTPLVTWLTLPQPGPALVRAEDGGNEMVTRE